MRTRLLAVVSILAITGAIGLDAIRPPSSPVSRAGAVPTAGGVLGCPYAVPGRGSAYVHLANVGKSASSIRITLLPHSGKAVVLRASVRAGGIGAVRVSGRVTPPAAALVEYSGGEIVATHSMWLPWVGARGGAAAAPCARPGGTEVSVPLLRTLGAEAGLAILNPGGAPADVTIGLITDARRLEPQRLSHRVIPPRSRRDFQLGDYAFDARALTAVVRSSAGRVVVEGLLESPRGIEIVAGTDPAQDSVAVAGIASPGAAASLTEPTGEGAAVDVRAADAAGQGTFAGAPSSVSAAAVRRVSLAGRSKGAVSLITAVRAGRPIVSGASWNVVGGRSSDEAGASAVVPSLHWALVGGSPMPRTTMRVFVVNSGTVPARVDVRIRGGRPSTLRVIPPGRLATIVVATSPGTVSVDLRADRLVSVVAQVIGESRTGSVFAYGLPGVVLAPPRSADVRLDAVSGASSEVGGR